jgi:zinc D-Ala-D-Ala carboxypeptidase
MTMRLTEHFSLEELTHSSTAVRLGIDNSPPDQVVGNLRLLADGLEQIRRVTGHALHIDCGYRCEALERLLCAKDYAAWCTLHGHVEDEASWALYFAAKAHPQGFAADFTCTAFGSPLEIVRVIRASGIKFDKAICEGAWVHVSFAPALRGVVMSASFDATGTPHYQDLAA